MGLSGRRLTLTLATILGVLLVVGAAGAFAVGRSQRLAGQPSGPSSPGAGSSAASGSSAGSSSGSSAGSPSASNAGSSSAGAVHSGPPAEISTVRSPSAAPVPPGSVSAPAPSGSSRTADSGSTSAGASQPISVTLSPRAAASPYAQQISGLLERYFTAINRRDYEAWLSTVSTAQAKLPYKKWIAGYKTTRDSDIYVSDINAGDPLTVRIQFVSHQSVELAPSALPEQCVRWDVTYQILDEGTGLRVGNSARSPSLAPCT